MKYSETKFVNTHYNVALFTRAWIEILLFRLRREKRIVALFTRAWIEIY